ncbi:2Fe-2S iron-sulfur cluster-binding protein [Mariniflexile maritimum]|uniref:2Fe-2S iron-sulfur cluster-binding protein n=1 Tax=Mariniflexile maritimum TaxID=2682493 RepID=UPI0012F68404|nr:2Fe-2S iron-sulfur cluster-binding protein [Mariniflexile maritimum]MCB0450353.1 (2Fe-2S)-binding protein [Confluentibacter sp.]HMQ43917.1 2Fe-2S iron-sulfur cluster-binding protein [Mariniflexile sp.]
MNYVVNIVTSDNQLFSIPFKRFEYPNLMELIVENNFEDIGECLGRGLCGTCHVVLTEGALNDFMEPIEKETIKTLNNTQPNSRLACQIMLDEKINNRTFKIITDNKINP